MSQDNSDKWAMPEPIFRRSTGELVHPSDIIPIDPEPDTLRPDLDEEILELPEDPLVKLYAPPEGHVEPAVPTPEPTIPEIVVEPQPYISEDFTEARVVVTAAKPKAKNSARLTWLLIGAILLIAAAASFVGFVYYQFFLSRTDTSGF